jgi:hypothetical protein
MSFGFKPLDNNYEYEGKDNIGKGGYGEVSFIYLLLLI